MTNLAQLLKEAEDDMQKKVRSTRPKEGEVSNEDKITWGGGGGVRATTPCENGVCTQGIDPLPPPPFL